MYVGLLLHLQRSECVPVAINANVTLVPKTIAFETPANDNDIYEDVSNLSSRGHKQGPGEIFTKTVQMILLTMTMTMTMAVMNQKNNEDQSHNGRSGGRKITFIL